MMSIDLKSIVENLKLSERSVDLQNHFNNSKMWRKENDVVQGTIRWLGFHSENYFSPFRACFLFEFASLQTLDYFSPLHCRDGAMTLLHFFLKNPKPCSEETVLLIQERLENLIPETWKDQCLLYKKVSKPKAFETAAPKKLIIMNSNLGQKQCSTRLLEKLATNEKTLRNQFDELVIVNFTPYILDTSPGRDQDTRHFCENILNIANAIQLPTTIRAPLDLQNQDLSNSGYLDLNEYNFYYSDSAFENLILEKGAKSILENRRTDCVYKSDLSFYHEIQFFKPNPKLKPEAEKIVQLFKKSSHVLEAELQHKPLEVHSMVKIVSSPFEDYAYELAKFSLDPVKIPT